MSDPLPIRPLAGPPDVSVTVPGSKSFTNRALLVAALASGSTTLTGVLFSDDTEAMLEALQRLGLEVEVDRVGEQVRAEGWDGTVPPGLACLNVRQAGTAARFLAPMLALGAGPYILDGSEQLRRRPMAELVRALRSLGVTVRASGPQGGLPLELKGGSIDGGALSISGSTSSQFLSGLLLSAPYFRDGLRLQVEDKVVSRPYLDVTGATMAAFGVDLEIDGYTCFTVRPGQRYRGTDFAIEPDASAASYFFAAAAMTGGRVRVEGLGRHAVQGDLRFVDVLERMGALVRRGSTWTEVIGRPLRGVDVDLADLSDTAPTLAAVAVSATGPTRISGIGFIRGKETDRIGSVATELRRCGIRADEEADALTIHPGRPHPAVIQTYEDHRMAMSFSLLGLVSEGIAIADPACVRKTFPNFFEVLERLR